MIQNEKKSSSFSVYLQSFPKPDSIEEPRDFEDMIISPGEIKEKSEIKHVGYRTLILFGKYQNELVAIKITENFNNFINEAQCLHALHKFDHIVKIKKIGTYLCHDIFTERKYFLSMELMHQSLQDLVQNELCLSWSRRARIALDIARALKEIEGIVIHRNIQPKHILLTQDGHAKLADFAFSIMDDDNNDEILDITGFTPPEIREGGGIWSSASDVFSYGKVLRYLLTRINDPLEKLPFPFHYPKDLGELYLACCHKNPAQRIKPDAIILRLEEIINSLKGLEEPSPLFTAFLKPFPGPDTVVEPEKFKNRIISTDVLTRFERLGKIDSSVYLAWYKDQKENEPQQVVLKLFDEDQGEAFERQTRILYGLEKSESVTRLIKLGTYQRLKGESIVRCYFLVMEWIPMTLAELIKNKSMCISTLLKISLNIAVALKNIEKWVRYFDLDSENILIDQKKQVTLAGFGHAKMQIETKSSRSQPSLSPKTILAFGKVLLHLFKQRYPYLSNMIPTDIQEISQNYSPTLAEFCLNCCYENPKKRLNINQIISQLQGLITLVQDNEHTDLSFSLYLQNFPGPDSKEEPQDFEDMVISFKEFKKQSLIKDKQGCEIWRGKYQNELVAIKVLNNFDDFISEARCLYALRKFKHIIKIKKIGTFLTHDCFYKALIKRRYFLSMELMHQSLYDLVESKQYLPWPQRAQIALDVAQALKEIEGIVIHRDISLGNILLTQDGHAKLADFGGSIMNGKNPDDKFDGTFGFSAPEIILMQGDKRKWSSATDVYSYGKVLQYLLMRKSDPLKNLLIPANYPEVFNELSLACCHKDPRQRIKPDTIISRLESIIMHLQGLEEPSPLFAAFLKPFHHSDAIEEPEKFKNRIMSTGVLDRLEKIGKAESSVYFARYQDNSLPLKSVLKLFDENQGEAFERQTRILCGLEESRSVTRLIKLGTYQQLKEKSIARCYFLVMEWIPITLADLIEKRSTSIVTRLQLTLNIAVALKNIEKCVRHFDIDSTNILIDQEGKVTLAGFGHAKMHIETKSSGGKPSLSPKTILAFGKVLLHLFNETYPHGQLMIQEGIKLLNFRDTRLTELGLGLFCEKSQQRLKIDDIISNLEGIIKPLNNRHLLHYKREIAYIVVPSESEDPEEEYRFRFY